LAVDVQFVQRVEFAPFELDLRTAELFKQGRKLRLSGQAAQLLVLLVQRAGELVTREELRAALWQQDTFVDFDHGLNNSINRVREVLGDSAALPHYVETLPKQGYRFVAEVCYPQPQAAGTPLPLPTGEVLAVPPTHRSRFLVALSIVILVVAAALLGWRFARPLPTQASIQSIAVLPFENLSGDPGQDYFADGINDALVTNLAQIHSLRVISRTSALQYRGSRKSLPDIAKELNVDAVVEGTFSRSNDTVRITAQLIQAATDRHIWAETYERKIEDILPMQSAIALEIARHVSAAVSAEEQLRLSRSPRIAPEAQEAYFRARYLMTLRGAEDLTKAPTYFQLAIAKDPNFADAYAGLAESYALLVAWGLTDEDITPKLAIAKKAVELDPESSTAHTAMALYLRSQRDREGSKREIRRALELNPNNSTAHKMYGYYLAFDGRLEEGVNEEMLAVDLDPLAAHMQISLAHLLSDAKQFDNAISHWQKALELNPSLNFLHMNIGWAYAHKGMREAAIREWLIYWARYPQVAQILTRAHEQSGYEGYLRALLSQDAAVAFRPMPLSHYQRAVIFTELGKNDLAFESLAKAIDERDDDLNELTIDPDLETLRSDPRFSGVVSRWAQYGLPALTSR
jgi:TolB-like protein/DNA-binding winged helix-turn-helix (wHTH) protein/Tfp pilus assembly protein PilF